MSIFDKYISVYNGVTDNVGTVTYLSNFLGSKRHIDRILALRAEEDEARRGAMKKSLPAATVSGRFYPKRNEDNLVEHTGFISIDIDGKDNPERSIEYVRNALIGCPFVAYAAMSVSGNGMFAIIPLAYPDRHGEQFDALCKDFHDRYGIILDKSCRDVSRLRFLSYDPNPYINEDASTYQGLIEYKSYLTAPSMTDADGDLRKVQRCVDVIVENGIDITNDYDEWISIGAALATLGEKGRYFFHEVSRQHPKYRYNETNSKFTTLMKVSGSGKKANLNTFFYWCRQYGVTYKREQL